MARATNAHCTECSIPCYQKPYLVRKGMRPFCSKSCLDRSRISHSVETLCSQCGGVVTQTTWEARCRPRKFCNRSCASKSQRGMKYTKAGYRNKQQARMAILKNTFNFSECMIEGCSYESVLQMHRFVRGENGGVYEVGNMFAICPNHHAEIHSGLAKDIKVSDYVLRLESN